ncbi:MAG: Hsp70 family protein [Armatimonadota bacterium]|nr:Hsp70 family protein [Armatimonadota bacterium]
MSRRKQIAIDLGTTNTVLAVAEEGSVRVLHLPGLAREQPSDQSPLVPSAIHYAEEVRRWLCFRRRTVRLRAGQMALHHNFDGRSPGYAQGFKRWLASQPHRAAARDGTTEISVRHAAFLFLRELLRAVRQQGYARRLADLTVTVPVGAFETYRAEIQSLTRRLGIRRLRSLDEPVAAALGYGVRLERERTLLVIDFGGGTLDLAVVALGPQALASGIAPVLAKHMVPLGGDDVDRWLAEHLLTDLADLPEWHCDARWEVMRLKEQVSRGGTGELRWNGLRRYLSHDDLACLLRERGLYDQLGRACADIRAQLEGIGVDEVLLTGGSTLLPGVPAEVDAAFPDAVVRHDPDLLFTAVALGAARFAGGVAVDDFIYHDYALAVQNPTTHAVEYELLVPRRTRYPSPEASVHFYADYAGMTEVRLHVCEVGRLGQAPAVWQSRPNGKRYWAPQSTDEQAQVVEVNPADAPLRLRPVGRGTSPRLRVTYALNADRWLCVTVEDLVSSLPLRVNAPVVRLR